MLRLMGEMLKLIWWVVTGLFRSRASLETEILTLRHQLNVRQRKAPKRPVFSNFDRLVFASLYRLPGLGVRTMPSGHKSFILGKGRSGSLIPSLRRIWSKTSAAAF